MTNLSDDERIFWGLVFLFVFLVGGKIYDLSNAVPPEQKPNQLVPHTVLHPDGYPGVTCNE